MRLRNKIQVDLFQTFSSCRYRSKTNPQVKGQTTMVPYFKIGSKGALFHNKGPPIKSLDVSGRP